MKFIKLLSAIFFLFFILAINKISAQAPGATCLAAVPLPLNSCTGAQTMTDFTSEGSSPAISCISGTFRREGWYSFTIPAGPSQSITVTGTSTTTNSDLAIQIISGTCASETQVSCANTTIGNSAQTEQATYTTGVLGSATTFFIRIINLGGVVNMVMQDVCIFSTPANDNCSGAIPLTPAASCTAGSSTAGTLNGATQSNVAGSACNPSANNDVWYSFVATGTTHAVTVTPSVSMDADFEIFTTSCGGANVADVLGGFCENNFGTGTAEFGSFSGLTPGQTYWIRVFDDNTTVTSASTFNISVTTLSNDECTGAKLLTSSASCTATSGCDDNATDSGIAPAGCAGAATPDDDVWYKFVATASSHLVTVTGSASFTPVFEVYSGSCAGLTPATGGCAVGASGGATITSIVTGLTIGNTYYVRVYDFGSGYPATSTFTICIGNPPPANDACAGAIVLTPACSPVATSGNVASSTQSLPATCTGVNTANDDVWYTFTTSATAAQPYVITVVGSASFDPVFQVYSGSCGGTNVTCINATGTGGTETTTLTTGVTLVASTQYWIRVYDATTATYPATTTFTIRITTPPVNDGCGGTTLTPTAICSLTVGSLCGGTSSGVAACTGTPTDDVWYNFIATATTHIISVTPCATMNPVIQVFSGSCGGTSINCTNLTGVGAVETTTLTGLTIGGNYWVRIYDFTGAPVCTAFGICISTPPANDNCTGAIAITPATTCTTVSGTDAGATQSMVAGTCGGNADDDVWYSWVAGGTDQTITVVGCANYNAVVEAYSGTCGALVSLGCVNATGAGGTESLVLSGLTGGTTYYIRVYDFGTGNPACNTFTICVVTPFNDFCNTAATIVCGGTYSGNTTTATYAGDPTAGCGGATVPNKGLWYIMAGTGQAVTISMCGLGPTWDSEILVFRGSCSSLTCVAGNDDNCPPTVGALSAITFGTVVGTNYYIFVGGWTGIGTTSGPYTFTVTCVTPPVNDQCPGAITVTCPNTYSGNTNTATPNNDITACGTANALIPSALWYVYTGDSTYLTISLCGSGFNTELGVWSAPSCSGPFTCVAGNNDFCGTSSQVTFMTSFGVLYYIEVFGFTVITVGQQTGAFTMTLSGGANPANPALTGCAPLPISLLTFTGHPEGARNKLEWTTASETLNNYFTLERAEDPSMFSTLAILPGAGTSAAIHNYEAYDDYPVNGTTYYRFKQTDYNGAYTYSNIIAVANTMNIANVSNMRPNPTTSDVNFDFFATARGNIRIQILDYTGRLVSDETQHVSDGASTISAKMAKLAQGIYSVRVSFDQSGYVSTTKVVKN